MWVWSDELAARLSNDGVDLPERVPLVAYAVESEAEIDELVITVLNSAETDASETWPASRRIVDQQ